MKKAMIAMSGGVDSSVAAFLAKQAGFSCVGATMLLHSPDTSAAEDARSCADRMGMPFHIIDLTKEFREAVMDDFVACYEEGLTPNPCVVCNRTLKFGRLLDIAREMGCDALVTGHYAQITEENGRYALKKAVDTAKDQSYFLYALTQEQLAHTRFPLGSLTKAEARQIAEAQGFLNAGKRDSQDICFIPDGDYYAFLCRHTQKTYKEGNYLDQEGRIVGRHKGAVAYTLGQRKGLNLAMGEPVYVCSKDMTANTVTVGPNEALFCATLTARDWNWVAIPCPDAPLRCKAKARSRMTEEPATVYPNGDGTARVVFDTPQRALTPGQAVVLYDGDTVLGGGTITEIEK